MSAFFGRPELAMQMADKLLRPNILDEGLRSGLFLSGMRRTGKTTFLQQDLIPALEDGGAIVIYVDLWSDTKANPVTLINSAIAKALTELERPGSGVLARLKRIKGVDLGAAGFKFGIQLDALGTKNGPTLAQALAELVDQAKADVVLIIDEVQQAMSTEEGNNTMLAIKAARDAINLRPDTPGHLLFVGTGSHRALVSEMTAKRNQAFQGAVSLEFPVLDKSYVAYLMDRLREEGFHAVPSLDVATQAFKTLGSRPEEMLKALRQLQSNPQASAEPDKFLPVIAGTLRSAAADVELGKVDELGALAEAIFARIASTPQPAKGLFSTDALAEYSQRIGRDVTADQVQRVAKDLTDANLIMRISHGGYNVADPFVQEVWQERMALGPLAPAAIDGLARGIPPPAS